MSCFKVFEDRLSCWTFLYLQTFLMNREFVLEYFKFYHTELSFSIGQVIKLTFQTS